MKALFRVYEVTKYDGTCVYATLEHLVGDDGKKDPNHPLWDEVNKGHEGTTGLGVDATVRLCSDNPVVYGRNYEKVRLFGKRLSVHDAVVRLDGYPREARLKLTL